MAQVFEKGQIGQIEKNAPIHLMITDNHGDENLEDRWSWLMCVEA
jgi:hypothetical protein